MMTLNMYQHAFWFECKAKVCFNTVVGV